MSNSKRFKHLTVTLNKIRLLVCKDENPYIVRFIVKKEEENRQSYQVLVSDKLEIKKNFDKKCVLQTICSFVQPIG